MTLQFSLLVFTLLIPLAIAHYPPHCRCVCHVSRDALFKARTDCFLPGAGDCVVRLCRNHDLAGFACCMPDASPHPLNPMVSRTPLPALTSSQPSLGPVLSTSPSPSHTHDDDGTPHPDMTPESSMSPEPPMLNGLVSGSPPSTDSGMDMATPSIEAFSSPSPSSSPHPNMATIRFAADDLAQLYLNGDMLSAINDWTAYALVSIQLFPGDVVGIEVTDIGGRWHGVIASIEFENVSYVTGRDPWRAIQAVPVEAGQPDWKSKEYNGCGWPLAVLKPNEDVWVPGKAISFPYSNGAKYVWAADATEGGSIYVRFVIGADGC